MCVRVCVCVFSSPSSHQITATGTSTSALVTSVTAASSFSKFQLGQQLNLCICACAIASCSAHVSLHMLNFCTDATPTLLKLKMMKGADGKPLKIIEKVSGGDYVTFGMCLLQDENCDKVELIEKDYKHKGAEGVTQAIIKTWLKSDSPTRTYQHLIECLRLSELGALAEQIAAVIKN